MGVWYINCNGIPFNGGGSITEKKTIGNRWFVEKVLGEWPVTIETDRVATDAIDK
jgi:hypothetical protein